MKKSKAASLFHLLVLAGVVSRDSAVGAEGAGPAFTHVPPPKEIPLEPAQSEARNRFSVGMTIAFNMQTEFRVSSGFASLPPAGPGAGPNVDRVYRDGYVRVDSSGNAGGTTWFWGYQHNSQYTGTAIQMHQVELLNASRKSYSNPNLGGELNYFRELWRDPWGRIGLAAGGHYTDMGVRSTQIFSGTATITTDSFDLNGSVPPGAPYRGTFGGPGTLLDATPFDRSITTQAAVFRSTEKFDASVLGLRLGPYYEFPLVPSAERSVTLMLGGGFAAAYIDSAFNFSQTLTVAGIPPMTLSGSGQGNQILGGVYAEARLIAPLSDKVFFYVGLQYQDLGSFGLRAGSSQVNLNMHDTFYYMFGVGASY